MDSGRDGVERPPGLSLEKTVRRSQHLELLVFELFCLVEKMCDEEMMTDEHSQYWRCRALYKALAHGRRPDGSKY